MAATTASIFTSSTRCIPTAASASTSASGSNGSPVAGRLGESL